MSKKEYFMSTKDVVKNLELPSVEFFMVMLAENNLIVTNLEGWNYGYNEILKTEKILHDNKHGKWKWSFASLDFLKNKLKIRTDFDVANNIITFID